MPSSRSLRTCSIDLVQGLTICSSSLEQIIVISLQFLKGSKGNSIKKESNSYWLLIGI